MNLNLLYSLGRPVEESDKFINKYTYLAYKYNYPYRIFNNKSLWSYYKRNKNNMDISISIQKFLEENENVLFIPNIINNEVVHIICRSFKEKKFMNVSEYKQTFYQIGNLSNNRKYYEPIILVEGTADCDYLKTIYNDVLACLTDSISSFNLQVLKSLTNNVLLCFDNDNAGKEAYIKESKKLRYNGISVRKINHVDNVKDVGDILEMEKNGFSDNEITYYKNNYLNQIIF